MQEVLGGGLWLRLSQLLDGCLQGPARGCVSRAGRKWGATCDLGRDRTAEAKPCSSWGKTHGPTFPWVLGDGDEPDKYTSSQKEHRMTRRAESMLRVYVPWLHSFISAINDCIHILRDYNKVGTVPGLH